MVSGMFPHVISSGPTPMTLSSRAKRVLCVPNVFAGRPDPLQRSPGRGATQPRGPGWAFGWARSLRRTPSLLFSGLLCVCISALSSSAFAQSCALCYQSAKASGNPRAIGHGILVLLIPTLLMFAGVLIFTIRRANSQQ